MAPRSVDGGMDARRLTSLFNDTVRANPIERPWLPVDRGGSCIRLDGPKAFLLWWKLTTDTLEPAVAAQADHARQTGKGLLWRVYDFDHPEGLVDCLKRHGFTLDEAGTLMFLDLAAASPSPADVAEGVTVRRATTPQGLEDFITANGAAFEEMADWQREAFGGRLDDPELALFVAYAGDERVAAGRLDMGLGDRFGYLFGGGVAPAHRGRGIYRALVAARVKADRAMGRTHLCTDARDTSRPILQSLGFVPVAGHTTWELKP
jgi:GNAT superfamily N-acetyltransferase